MLVAGPDVTSATPHLRPGATIVGVRFQPGAARYWLGLPMSEIVGTQVDLTELWGKPAAEMSERIGEGSTAEQRSALLQSELLKLMPEREGPSHEAAMVFGLMQRDAREPGAKISSILDRLETSERTLRRKCHEHFGYGPKTLDRILRFQRFLSLANALPDATLAGLAYDVGYADQAHLTREVKGLTGLSARSLVRRAAA